MCKCAQNVYRTIIDWLSLNGDWFYNVLHILFVIRVLQEADE